MYSDYYSYICSMKSKTNIVMKRKLTDEFIRNVALQYEYKADFRKYSPSEYWTAKTRHILKDFTWLKTRNIYNDNRKIDNIYCYIFKDFNSVYVGRTINIKERDIQHRTTNTSVFKFVNKNNIVCPNITVLENNLTVLEGREREEFWCKQFIQKGFTLLNKAPVGKNCGAIGRFGMGIYTKDHCFECATKCKTMFEFKEKYLHEFVTAYRHHWMQSYDWLYSNKRHRCGYYTYERCFEIARTCKTQVEMSDKDYGAYDKAKEKNWLKDYTWFVNGNLKRTFEECLLIANQCKNKQEFRTKDNGKYYSAAKRNKWLNDLFPSNEEDVRKRKVQKINITTNEIIDTYESISLAALSEPGMKECGITNACKGRTKTYKGYIWKYCYESVYQ